MVLILGDDQFHLKHPFLFVDKYKVRSVINELHPVLYVIQSDTGTLTADLGRIKIVNDSNLNIS
jgi:hypothetical protein